MSGDDALPPSGHIQRHCKDRGLDRPISYAPTVPRIRRDLPAAPADRRRRARPAGQPWRGRLIDLER
jgi:hypothetical protein